jgi:hypothetical protein
VCGFNRISNDHARGVYRKKTPGGAGTHMGGTSLTRHQEEHVHTDEPHNHPSKPTTHNPLPVKRHRRSRDTHGTHTGHAGAQRHTDHTDELYSSKTACPVCVSHGAWCPVCVPAPPVSFYKTVQRHREPGHTQALPVQTGGAGTRTERSKSSPVNASQVKSSLDSTASLESTFNNRLKVVFCICSDLT